jgi:MFS family permease
VDDLVDKLGWGPYQNRLMFQCGVFWSADAVEVMVMSIALHSIKEQWFLTDSEASLIPLVTFAGLLVGAPTWGVISDRRGRRFGYFFSALMMGLFGMLSAACPESKVGFYLFLALRLIVGFAVGGGSAGYALFCELVGAYFALLKHCAPHALTDSLSRQRQKTAHCHGYLLVSWHCFVCACWMGFVA